MALPVGVLLPAGRLCFALFASWLLGVPLLHFPDFFLLFSSAFSYLHVFHGQSMVF